MSGTVVGNSMGESFPDGSNYYVEPRITAGEMERGEEYADQSGIPVVIVASQKWFDDDIRLIIKRITKVDVSEMKDLIATHYVLSSTVYDLRLSSLPPPFYQYRTMVLCMSLGII